MPQYTVIIPRIVNIRAHVSVQAKTPEAAMQAARARLETVVDPGQWLTHGFPDFDASDEPAVSWSYEAFELDDEGYWTVQDEGGEDVTPPEELPDGREMSNP